ncbi:hypothetical protein S7711_04496 [Stachybotrys chartarum IBT 7711]|uniref:Uncharacterized protein n=1 Tax=Stachybotrys chartarum (strain CBS 109288 / IBT 7711) TaxID=1280523 RepID=A0A084BA80_STACB|nr:hypothetical protein S7711_04496 [Stachybotrys chartarum IBT 7711]
MSWMDSWSRPTKSQATPSPYYLLPGGENTPYCHSCGRVIGTRRTGGASNRADTTPVKYCSSRCRAHKPGKLDRGIETVFVRLLEGQPAGADKDTATANANTGDEDPHDHKKNMRGSKRNTKKVKGDARILILCDTVEKQVFQRQEQSHEGDTSASEDGSDDLVASKLEGQDTPSAHPRPSIDSAINLEIPIGDETEYIDGDVLARMSVRSGTRVRPPQSVSEVNGSVGGEKGRAERIVETEEMLEKRREGQRRVKEKEMVKCAARRGVVFGFTIDQDKEEPMAGKRVPMSKNDSDKNSGRRKKCEAVMNGQVVEPSFAKGNWGIRWREE